MRRTRFTLKPRLATGVLACAAALAACGPANTPEQQVRAAIGQMELAAEARDVGDLMQGVSDQYRDDHGHGPDEISRYVRGYFIANQAIHLLTRVEQIEFPGPDEARAQVLVGMVGRDAEAGGAWDLAADLVEFDVALVREDDDWKVTWARWKQR